MAMVDTTSAFWLQGSEAAQALAYTLLERYPAAFHTAAATVRPLKVGIHRDIWQALDVPPAVVRDVLHGYMRRRAYRTACLVPGAMRVDLHGQPVEPVAPAYQQRLARQGARHARKPAGTASASASIPRAPYRGGPPSPPTAAVPPPRTPIAAAGRRLGLAHLYPEQARAIAAVLAGQDVLMVQPTGFGKSACYQVPSLLLPRPVVVVSPLLALLRDQQAKMLARQVPVVRLDSTVPSAARRTVVERIAAGGGLLVLTTPETLMGDALGTALAASGMALAAVDEAHCLSEWGHDFRPAYRRLGARLRALGAPPLLALTATATQRVRDDIVCVLGMRHPTVIASTPHRANLAFEVVPSAGDARVRALTRLAQRLRRPGIIYCATTTAVDALYGALRQLGLPVHRYHGRMRATERTTAQAQFLQTGRRTILVATSAFGLGIDKPDIRFVVHYHAPASLEQYVQEAGRAGRDGRTAQCILLYDPQDRAIHEALQQRSRVRPEHLARVIAALWAWASEERLPEVAALTVAAQLTLRQTHAVLAVLAEVGLVTGDAMGLRIVGAPAAFADQARGLATRFATLRTQDGHRLDHLAAYAESRTCRAMVLRVYFGDEAGDPCGRCDRCRGTPERPATFWQPLARQAPSHPRRRRRGRRVDARQGGASSHA